MSGSNISGQPPYRIDLGGRFEQLMSLLGLGPGEFDGREASHFDAAPSRWLQEKLAKLGFVRVQPECKRPCCQAAK